MFRDKLGDYSDRRVVKHVTKFMAHGVLSLMLWMSLTVIGYKVERIMERVSLVVA